MTQTISEKSFFTVLSASLAIVFIWSAIDPRDRATWFLEVLPVIVAVILLLATYRVFEFTRLVYTLIWMHAIILMIGGHYTYAEVPLFDWIRDTFGFARNHYDRLGHFAQGFFPAMVAREILIRLSPLKPGKWLFTIVVCVCLAISAFYELIEWWVAIASDAGAEAFLGTQGDQWDTQWDMFLALCGAIVSQLVLGRFHDRALKRLSR